MIKTPMEDRSNKAPDLIRFALKNNAVVYVGLKDEAKVLPAWLADWEATGVSIDASNKLMIYQKNFSAGETAELGSIVSSGISCMYTVVIKEK
ncbi:hypothetical protein P4B35_23125 [Pontiellaceae bacterium B12227]|nr:hypothetical protein [Pontiellaceae bacterium B12227]